MYSGATYEGFLENYFDSRVDLFPKPINDENSPANHQNTPDNDNKKSVKDIDSRSEKIDRVKEETKKIEEINDDATNLSLSANVVYNDNYQTFKTDSADSTNDFGEAECGEPYQSQHLTIDFNFTKDDTDFVQQKCSEFWTFINSKPELRHLMVVPETDKETPDKTDKLSDQRPVTKSLVSKSPVLESTVPEPTVPESSFLETAAAIHILPKIADGPIPSSFAAKPPVICRNRDYLSYCHGSDADLDAEILNKLKYHQDVTTRRASKGGAIPTKEPPPPTPLKKRTLVKLCTQMETWDLNHPKSFDPPQMVPTLSGICEVLVPQATQELPCATDVPSCLCVNCSTTALECLDHVDLEMTNSVDPE